MPFVRAGMIKKLTCASALAAVLLACAAPAAGAADAVRSPAPGAPGASLLSGLLGSLETGNPPTSLNTLLPAGVLGH
ncbi:hypothetical protein [Streptomyces sp. NPDC049590]|uniref:hypothetical protein n=1 Tax=Streptomyces sp. NPDC049590 TaxID=3154834 RepID=UPI00342BEC6E